MEDKIKILANGGLDDMRKALPGMAFADLEKLRAAEVAGKKRAGALEMIVDAMKASGEQAGLLDKAADAPPPPPLNENAGDPPAPPPSDPVQLPPETGTSTQFAPIAPPVPAIQPPEPMDPDAGKPAAPSEVKRSMRIVLTVPSDRRDLLARLATALTEGDSVAIVLADADGELLNVPPVEARRHDFQQFGGQFPKLIYQPKIEIGDTLPAVSVRQLFLLVEPALEDDGPVAAVAVCRLTTELHGGGGRRAEIPEGNLLFDLS